MSLQKKKKKKVECNTKTSIKQICVIQDLTMTKVERQMMIMEVLLKLCICSRTETKALWYSH